LTLGIYVFYWVVNFINHAAKWGFLKLEYIQRELEAKLWYLFIGHSILPSFELLCTCTHVLILGSETWADIFIHDHIFIWSGENQLSKQYILKDFEPYFEDLHFRLSLIWEKFFCTWFSRTCFVFYLRSHDACIDQNMIKGHLWNESKAKKTKS